MSPTLTLVRSTDRTVEDLLRVSQSEMTVIDEPALAALASGPAPPEGLFVVDMRGRSYLPAAVTALKRRQPSAHVVIVASCMEPELMRAAMRAGVNEWLTDPVDAAQLQAAVEGGASRFVAPTPAEIFAFVGSHGGVGTTTVAVNIATELAHTKESALLMDLHVAFGDALLFLGGEARFSLIDAVENAPRLDEAFFRSLVVRAKGRPDVLASPFRTRAVPIDGKAIRRVVEFASWIYRRVVLDMTLFDPASSDVLGLVTKILVVTSQELTAVRNASRIVTDLRAEYGDDRVEVVINRFDRNAEISLEDVERGVKPARVHQIGSDYREAVKALNAGVPLTLGNARRLSAAFRALARHLARTPAAKSDSRSRDTMFSRLAGRRAPVGFLGAIR